MSDEESRFKILITYGIIGAVFFAAFLAPILFFVLHRFVGWEPPQFLQDWIAFFEL